MLEIHWPVIPDHVIQEAMRLQKIAASDWKPPGQKGAVVESKDAGIIHSPALGFVMDIYPVIRVIYAAEDKRTGRKLVLYLDSNGKSVPIPRTLGRNPEKPLDRTRSAAKPR